ncbi:hypothetical protein AJ79_09384 [Helicocarpus griseus UAMH5409]|uniref:Uncharacterized protein n=1 Tax=Helicocarpus griseus UAMH5409 TaxID=1447875 RepID=A0A2B7WKE4_9EURO|nr:hypothetical protein AJ79_09384 [Helicocarpus griseus UAMH5409]
MQVTVDADFAPGGRWSTREAGSTAWMPQHSSRDLGEPTFELSRLRLTDLPLTKYYGNSHRNLLAADDRRSATPSSRTPSRTPSNPPSPGPEMREIIRRTDLENEEDYNYLIENGGRPAFPLEMCRAAPPDHGEYANLIRYWAQSFRGQRNQWVAFRNFQRRRRKTMDGFTQYLQQVREHRQKEADKLDDWKEYHYYLHSDLPFYRKKAEEGRKQREQDARDWDAGKRDPLIPPDMDWIHHVRTQAESEFENNAMWVRWIEDQIPIIEQECAELAGQPNEPSLPLAEEEQDKAQESGTWASADVKSTSSDPISHPQSNRTRPGTNKRSVGSLGVVGSPRVSTHKVAQSPVTARHLDRADFRTEYPASPRQSNASLKRATRTKDLSHASRRNFSRQLRSSMEVPAETVSLRRSQRIIDLAAKKLQQQKLQEREVQDTLTQYSLPNAKLQKQLKGQRAKAKGPRSVAQDKPRGISKPGSSRSRKHNPLPTANARSRRGKR